MRIKGITSNRAMTYKQKETEMIEVKKPEEEKEKTIIADEMQPEYLDQTLKKKLRWIMLALSCVFVVPNYFCYDNPATVETYIESYFDKTPS